MTGFRDHFRSRNTFRAFRTWHALHYTAEKSTFGPILFNVIKYVIVIHSLALEKGLKAPNPLQESFLLKKTRSHRVTAQDRQIRSQCQPLGLSQERQFRRWRKPVRAIAWAKQAEVLPQRYSVGRCFTDRRWQLMLLKLKLQLQDCC